MSAPQIPNLLALRGGGRGGGRRGRGRGQHLRAVATAEDMARKDRIVQQTDSDASLSRLSAVNVGYLEDPFAKEFVTEQTTPRRYPIINRGTYVRTTAIDRLVEQFIGSNTGRSMQIISLGAGSDTRYWRLREKNIHKKIMYHEIDFPTMSRLKFDTIRNSKALSPKGSSFGVLHNVVPAITPEIHRWGFFRDGASQTDGYLFHPIDLRKRPFAMQNLLTNVPTLVISECCLCYLPVDDTEYILRALTSLIPTIGIAIYEPVNPEDSFGQVMFSNLAVRGLHMPTILEYPTLHDQINRLSDAKFTHAQTGAHVSWLWKNWVSEEEKGRVSKLEMVDEVEEWDLLAYHYTVVWAWKEDSSLKNAFNGWVENCKGEKPYVKSEF